MPDVKKVVALFRHVKYDNWASVFENTRDRTNPDYKEPTYPNYVRVSEWVDLEFVELPKDQQTANAIFMLDRERESTVKEFTGKLRLIDERKAQLLAISHQPGPVPEAPAQEAPLDDTTAADL